MTTMRDIVTEALRRIKVVAAGESPSAEDAQDALTRLNDFIQSWQKKGWAVVDSSDVAYTYPTLVLSDTWPLDDGHIMGIKAILAKMMAEEFGQPIGPQLAMDAKDGMDALRGDYFNVGKGTLPRYLRLRRWR